MRSAWCAMMVAMLCAAILPSGPTLGAATDSGIAHPDRWPTLPAPATDPAIERRVEALLAAMSLEQKVGQIIQGDIASTSPEDVRAYHLGSIPNGGSSSLWGG